MFLVFDPTLVLPLYVVMVNVITTESPSVFWLAKESGGVQEMLVSLDFVQIVPDALPHLYVIVWVKLLACLVTVRVCAVPSFPLEAARVLFLGIVVNAFDADAVTVPLLT
jgi:hypothetical protein